MNTLVLLLFRIGAMLSHVSKKLTEQNHISNEKLFSNVFTNDYIENQMDLSDFSLGKYNFSFSGCGCIAVINLLKYFGNSLSFSEFSAVTSFFENKGLIFSGRFGISPLSIKSYFQKNGYTVKALKSSKENEINEFARDFDAFICIFFNQGRNIKYGLHYIAVTHSSKDLFESHNPNMTANTLSEVIHKASFEKGKALYTIGINKN